MFDTDILRARGIPASVATHFQTASLFPPGINYPNLVVNGKPHGIVSVTFNDQGALCANVNFLKAAGILTKQPEGPEQAQQSTCHSLPAGTEVKLQPGRQRVELLVPPQLVDNSAPETVYVSGGSAALLNYNLYATGNHSRHNRSHTFYGHTESGFNADNWVVRSYDSYSGHGNKAQFHHQSAWVQRTFPAFKSTLQAGQLTLNSSLFSSSAFNGLQARPESALLKKTDNGVRVTGIAPSAARVEVRQGGTLIYSTLVPAGPFVLDNLPLNNASQDLEVSVIESSGGQRHFIVPAASFSSNFVPVQQGWTVAAGQPRETGRCANVSARPAPSVTSPSSY
ncbi:MAG: fimbria/pilus outer membrane usher protein [Sodalis sp. (in: enterobacteria)]|uniref:fimbria/pilus outer membrane usher protein n=1 Tax=Sodalis sp. (in: enterobacteria) TaxID=1898979 RepID=UPI0039E34F35